jgi:hypothetical protein
MFMIDMVMLASMRQWIIDKLEENKKNLEAWQTGATFVGIFISAVTAIGLFLISKPLAISSLLLLGLSFLIPLFIQSVPFSKDNLILLAIIKKYKNIIMETLAQMNVGIDSVIFPESILDKDVKIRIMTRGVPSEISMREVNGEIKFYHNNELIVAKSRAY